MILRGYDPLVGIAHRKYRELGGESFSFAPHTFKISRVKHGKTKVSTRGGHRPQEISRVKYSKTKVQHPRIARSVCGLDVKSLRKPAPQ